MITPDFFISLIVDGMDQNTTMVPKMRQIMKNIESRFVKTHLCEVLVHGIGLYVDVWIDAHHKHDSNQVIKSVMHVIANVRRRKGRLPPTLQIQADNCTRESKNIYMFALCATLVGLGYFQEVQLCFLIVGHTHEDIDQCFNIISNTLKRTNIDSLKELLELVQLETSYMEAFVSARHLENVRDGKSFIMPHLLTRGNTITGITFPHHMRFYMENGVIRVQYKYFSKDAWGPTDGLECLRSLPNMPEKPTLAEVHRVEERELKALDEFIAYKTRCVERLQNVEKNLQTIEETKWLKEYLEHFPDANREAQRALPFWPHEQDRNGVEDSALEVEVRTEDRSSPAEVGLIMATMPDPEAKGYFGPRRSRPATIPGTRAPRRRATSVSPLTVGAGTSVGGEDRFPAFNPGTDIRVGHFVAHSVEQEELRVGVPFHVGKVLEFGKERWAEKMIVIWYWPCLGIGMQTGSALNIARFGNCMEGTWEPLRERHGWVMKEATIFLWEDVPRRTRARVVYVNEVWVYGVTTEAEVQIPVAVKPHLLEYMDLQM
jgi:hypothetical protein